MTVSDLQKIETGDSVKVKQVLDESVVEAMKELGYEINYTMDNRKLLLMFAACVVAATAQFYPLPFPQNRPLLAVYFILSMLLQYVILFVDQDTIVTAKSKKTGGSSTPSTLSIASIFPKYQETYTLHVTPSPLPRNTPCDARTIGEMYVGKYFTAKGEYDEEGFKRDVKALVSKHDSKQYKTIQFNHKSD